MNIQIAVRLPEDVVSLIDQWVTDGRGKSRAEIVLRALERERRRQAAERDAAIYADMGEDPDLDGLARHAAGVALDID